MTACAGTRGTGISADPIFLRSVEERSPAPRPLSQTHRLAPLTLIVIACACDAPGERVEPAPPARAVLEVVLDDSVITPRDSVALSSGLGAMCLRGDPALGEGWTVGQVDDSLTLLELERITTLAPRDSARLAARLARTADALPGDTSVADFRGLPVVIRDAWLLVPAAGDTTFVAIASRRVPMESSPHEEQLMLLATPDTAGGTSRALVARWFARSAGMEDSLETRDPVLAYRSPDGLLRLLLLRETSDEPVVESLARVDGRWRRHWVGTLARCR